MEAPLNWLLFFTYLLMVTILHTPIHLIYQLLMLTFIYSPIPAVYSLTYKIHHDFKIYKIRRTFEKFLISMISHNETFYANESQ